MMFGDVGQGIVLSLVGYFFYKWKGMQLGAVGMRLGISSTILDLSLVQFLVVKHCLNILWNQCFYNGIQRSDDIINGSHCDRGCIDYHAYRI